MPEIIRTNSDNPNFLQLVVLLDEELTLRYGDLQKHYAQFNHIDFIDTVVVAVRLDDDSILAIQAYGVASKVIVVASSL